MMHLATLQQHFRRALLEDDLAALSAALRANKKRTAKQSIAIYQNNMRAGLLNALKQIYPATRHYLSDDYFLAVARGYILLHPSHTPDLNFYGQDFSQFIAQLQHDYSELAYHAFLPELALAERYCHESYYAEDTPPFDFQAFEKIAQERTPEHIYFKRAPCLFLMRSVHPLEQLKARLERVPEPSKEAQTYSIYRQQWRVVIEPIQTSYWDVLQDMTHATSLAVLSQRHVKLDQVLPRLIEKSWVCAT